MSSHIEKIKCPFCNTVQDAEVEHKIPFYDYTHECTECLYDITESEWEKVA
jgi:C4-type Zn-finger protein